MDLDVGRLLRTLDEHGVVFVVVGGIAGVAHGSASLTDDLDICYERSNPNTRALARALRDMQAVLIDGEHPLAREVDARALELGNYFLFRTAGGRFDCLAAPDGTNGFEELEANAVWMDIAGVRVRVSAIDDLIRMKLAAGRAKDRAEVEILGALREEMDRRTSS